MNKKLAILVSFFVLISPAYANTDIVCQSVHHTPGQPWTIPEGWEVLKDSPNSKLTEVPGNFPVYQAYGHLWYGTKTITCRYMLEDPATAPSIFPDVLVISMDVTDKKVDEASLHLQGLGTKFRNCQTTASSLENCRVTLLD